MEFKNNKNVSLQISFDDTDKMEESYGGAEFHILKGTLFSLCEEVKFIENENINM